MIDRFEEFVSNIALAYKYIIKIKAYKTRRFGIKGAHVMTLFFLGKHPEGLTATELGELCREDKAGISKALSALKEHGYIETEGDAKGKKYRSKFKMSKKGKEVYEEISDTIVNVVKECGGELSDAERTAFYNTLGRIVINMEKFSEQLENNKENK